MDSAWETVVSTIRDRRSNLNVDPERPVPRELVEQLLDLATWAPNHYRTNPWRFVVLTGPARARVGEIAARALQAAGRPERVPSGRESIVERQRTQFLRAPAVIVAASAPDEDPIKHFENKHAVAAGVQNILLGAQAAGLAGAWRSGLAMTDPAVSGPVKEALGLEPGDEIVSFVYLGYPIAPPGTRQKPPAVVRYLDS